MAGDEFQPLEDELRSLREQIVKEEDRLERLRQTVQVSGEVQLSLSINCAISCTLDGHYNGSCSVCGQAEHVYRLKPVPLSICDKCLAKYGEVRG